MAKKQRALIITMDDNPSYYLLTLRQRDKAFEYEDLWAYIVDKDMVDKCLNSINDVIKTITEENITIVDEYTAVTY